MKNLKDQIEFIDKKLIVLFGFKGITDYTHIINITDVDTIKIDLNRINELIPDFRKVFHAKNFSLHKTDYKIQTDVQAVCLLKTCLEVTSIPFDVSLKKNKRIMRLISKNNVLEDYINTLKMSENGILKANTIEAKTIDKGLIYTPGQQIGENLFFLGKDKPTSDTVVSPWYSSTIKPDEIYNDNQIYKLKSDVPNPKAIVTPWIPEEHITTQKQIPKIETITKEILNQSIKTTLQYGFSLDLNNKLITKMRNSGIPSIEIDLKKYEMSDKSVKGCVVSIKSKTINGNPIISQDFINGLLSDITWDLCIGGPQIYEDRFVNSQEIIISNIILVCKCLSLHNIVFRLQNINKLMNYLDMLEIEFNVTYVKFYTELDNKLTEKNWIHQQIEHHSLFNKLRIGHGMAGLAYSQYQTKKEYLELESGFPTKKFEEKYLDELIEKLETKPYKCVSMPNLNGLELVKYDHNMFKSIENGYITNKYDYITWKDTVNIPIDFLQYYKMIKGNDTYVHCYEIPLSGTHDTIREIILEIPDFTYKTLCIGRKSEQSEPLDIEIEFLDYFNRKVQKGLINNGLLCYNYPGVKNIIDNIINEDDKHLLTYDGIGALKLKIKSNSSESPIKCKKNIILTARYYSWQHNHLHTLINQYCKNYYFVYPNKLN